MLDVDAIDYLEIRDPNTLETITEIKGPARAFVAAKLGQTRLIDNMELEMSSSDMVLFAVMAVMGINHLTLRLPGWDKSLWLFWLTQLCNLGMACHLIWSGILDFQGICRL